jgi:GNAT superfamily N-acetyltransferase
MNAEPQRKTRALLEEFSVVNTQTWMAEPLEAIQAASFPGMVPEELIRAEHFRAHLERFPEGQYAILERATNRVVASSTDFRTRVDFGHYQHRYIEAVGGNWLTTHQPDGDWLYGADIGVHPEYRGLGLSKLLYQARQDLTRRLGLRGHVFCGMPVGYGAASQIVPIEEYVSSVIAGEVTDPTLTPQLRRSYRAWGIVPDYIADESSSGYAVFMVWRNPDVKW